MRKSELALGVAAVGILTSTAYLILVGIAVIRFKRRVRTESQRNPGPKPFVSLLKPVHGEEPNLDDNLRSFFQQRYPRYEVLFCARHAGDAGLSAAERLQSENPCVSVSILHSGEPQWGHPKTYSIQKMMDAAKSDVYVITDSDVAVPPDFLSRVVRALQERGVGLVTCLYRGVALGGLPARLEALGMTVEMSSGVLVAEMLEGMKFALGPCMALTRKSMTAAGGLEAISHYYAEDFVLGNRVAEAGFKVVLSDVVVNHFVTNGSWRATLKHQLDWARSTRFSRKRGYVWEGLVFSVPYGLLGLLAGWAAGRLGTGWMLFNAAFISRVAQCLLVGGWALEDQEAIKWAWLYPFRDLIGFGLWAWAYRSNTVIYGGEIYELYEDGKIRSKYVPGLSKRVLHLAKGLGVPSLGSDHLPGWATQTRERQDL